MRHPLLLVSVPLALLAAACGSSDSGTGGAPAGQTGGDGGGGGSRLSAAAIAEMKQLGVERYRGQAVITGEETQGEAKRVTFDPSSGPICLRGADYAAFYLDRGSDKTMILLDGGGACWSALCVADETADATISLIGPASDSPDSYFRDWNLVFAPYCDGSVFSGDNEVQEAAGTRYHHGRQNLAAALDLAEAHFGDSKQVLLGGFSAGGYGTLPGMVATRLIYPTADLFVLDDSGPGVQNLQNQTAIQQRLDEWKFADIIPPSCTGCDGGHGQLTQMFSWMMKNDPTVKISLLSYYGDSVIGTAFNGLDAAAYEELLRAESGKVEAEYPDRFKRYMEPGTSHVLSGAWATLTADGVKLSDWVTAMVTGDDGVWKDLLAAGP